MRNKRSTFCLLTVLCTHVGCSQTGGVRPSPPSNVRTIASVGDKPLPSVSGEPGASLRADSEDLDLPASSGSRISGRVFDDRGKPVPNARVRLAVSSSPGGRVISDTTKRDGSFTLRGLRPGSTYAVIAEYQGDDGIITGRTQAKANQVGVRISLQPRGSESNQGHASIQPARPRVEPISNIDPVDEETSDEDRSAGKVNAEDLEPPADDAASLAPRRNVRLSRAADDNSRVPVRGGWNSRQVPSNKAAGGDAEVHDSGDDAAPTSRSPVRDDPGANLDDDGPNPLPPALDTAAATSRSTELAPDDEPVKVARNTTGSSTSTKRRPIAGSRGRDDEKAIGIMDAPGEREPRSMPDDILPGARVITPGSSAPIAVSESPDDDNSAVAPPRSSRRAARPSAGRPTNPPSDADSPESTDSPAIEGTSSTAVRPTWRELAHNPSEVPLDESIRRAAGNAPADDRGVVTLTSKTSEAKPGGLSRLLGGSRPPIDSAVKPAVCRFDSSNRRLVDFQLPNLDGKMVSMHDIDADVILLDFWGSWCAPCRTSIPHLAELQATLGPKRLQVIGIACEKGSSLQDRRSSAGKAIQELEITYPVLLSSKEGTCPVQQALQIQFYPTMIVLDRDGKLLAREQGATEVTMARIDRAINTALRGHDAPSERTVQR
jgi:thiol-disulfide isomerase/thioredoxin